MFVLEITIAITVLVRYYIIGLISVEVCSWEIEIGCTGLVLLSSAVQSVPQ